MEQLLAYYRTQFGITKEEEANLLLELQEQVPKTVLGNQLVQERIARVQAENNLNVLGQELVQIKLKLMKAGL